VVPAVASFALAEIDCPFKGEGSLILSTRQQLVKALLENLMLRFSGALHFFPSAPYST
jgi:hypothetical protein